MDNQPIKITTWFSGNGRSIQTLLRGENDSKQSSEIQAIGDGKLEIAFNCGDKHEQRRSVNSSGWKTFPHSYKLTAKKRVLEGINKAGLKIVCHIMGLPGTGGITKRLFH